VSSTPDSEHLVTFNGGCVAGYLPRSVLASSSELGFSLDGDANVPVCLQRGDPLWGFEHIHSRHARSLRSKIVIPVHKIDDDLVVPAALWMKLRTESGKLFDCQMGSKAAAFMPLRTPVTIIFRRALVGAVEACSVTTMYVKTQRPEGVELGRFSPIPALPPAQRKALGPLPSFAFCSPANACWRVEADHSSM